MSDLAEFLLARIVEDEQAARAATVGPWRWDGDLAADEADLWGPPTAADEWDRPVITATGMHTQGFVLVKAGDAEHIARHHPARVLAECEAKRRIVTEHADEMVDPCVTMRYPCPTLKMLAQPYASHPQFHPSWLLENEPG